MVPRPRLHTSRAVASLSGLPYNINTAPERWSLTVFMNSSWMFANKKAMNVQQYVYELFMNILEQQIRLSWKFMSSLTYSFHERSRCSWTWVVHEWPLTQIIYEPELNHERTWTEIIHESDGYWKFITFIKCVRELFMNVPKKQMRHTWNSWIVNLVHELRLFMNGCIRFINDHKLK